MKLTPLEIRKQEFKKSLRGVDPQEVQVFLEMVANHYEEVMEENKALNRRIIEVETKMQDFQQNEKNLRETLLNVQEVKKQSEESSRRQADLIIKDAELKALELLENARKETRQIREEVSWLKAQKESFINRIRHILTSQIELLSVMEIDDIIPAEAASDIKKLKSGRRTEALGPAPISRAEPRMQKKREVPETELSEGDDLSHNPAEETDLSSSPKAREIRTFHEAEPQSSTRESREEPAPGGDLSRPLLTEEDINDFFKKGIQIDDLIKTINKKELDK
ncbi:MAG TPA: DivIVA domain-containing protein [Calditrichia bacterium]|nr:DivIVA domain-containing protein [Calditrichota bacterium]HQU71201.1 DivIVA domain-containing protein [Calditrichia bacterium]HQV30715.1 DivIVA domain-containing protein [Calditrichia bacterium]